MTMTEDATTPQTHAAAGTPNPAETPNRAGTPNPAASSHRADAPTPAAAPSPAASGTAAPSPARRPSPIPVPVPAPAGTPSPASGPVATTPTVPAVEASDPHRFGRIDADGTVYVRTADGERKVGSWQAGDAEAGLAHFGRRFDDFVTEIALLEARLASGTGDATATRQQATALLESIDTLAAVGDFEQAAARLDAVLAAAQRATEQAAAARAQARADAVHAKEQLCAEAESLASSTQWKATGDRFKAIVGEWRTIHGVDRKTDDALWRRFAKARDAFTRARGSHFADLDKQRLVAKAAKEKLIVRAQALSGSRDWTETTAAYRELMTEWKAAGRAPRDVEDSLWEQFRAAQDAFFARRNEVFAQRDAEFEANAAVKEKLLAEAERLDPRSDLEAAKTALRSIQDRWEAAGKVPRDRIKELDGRLRAVEDRVRAAADAEWRRSDPEATARAQQFRDRVAQFREQAAKARAAGDERKAREAEQQAKTWEGWLSAAENAIEN